MTTPRVIDFPDENSQDTNAPKLVSFGGPQDNYPVPAPVRADITRAEPPVPKTGEVSSFDVAARYIKSVVPSIAPFIPAAKEFAAPEASLALMIGPSLAREIPKLIEGVPSSDELMARRKQLLTNKDELERARLELTNKRQNAVRITEGGVPSPFATPNVPEARYGDVIQDINEKIAAARANEEMIKQSNPSGLNRTLLPQPEMDRMDVLLNIAKLNPASMVAGLFYSPIHEAMVARGEIKDPNITQSQAADALVNVATSTAAGLAAGGLSRSIMANRAEARIAMANARARAAMGEPTPEYPYGEEATKAAQRINQLRTASGLKPLAAEDEVVNPPTPVTTPPKVSPITRQIIAHFDERPNETTVIPNIKDVAQILEATPPALREKIAGRVVIGKNGFGYIFGDNSPLMIRDNAVQVENEGFYNGQPVSYHGIDGFYRGVTGEPKTHLGDALIETKTGLNVKVDLADIRVRGAVPNEQTFQLQQLKDLAELSPEEQKRYDELAGIKKKVMDISRELEGTKTPGVYYHGTPIARETLLGEPREAFSPEKTGPENLYGQGAGYFTDNPEVAGGTAVFPDRLGYATPKPFQEVYPATEAIKDYYKVGKVIRNEAGAKYFNGAPLPQFEQVIDFVQRLPEGMTEEAYQALAGEPSWHAVLESVDSHRAQRITSYIPPELRATKAVPQVFPVRISMKNPFDINKSYSEAEVRRIFDIAKTYKLSLQMDPEFEKNNPKTAAGQRKVIGASVDEARDNLINSSYQVSIALEKPILGKGLGEDVYDPTNVDYLEAGIPMYKKGTKITPEMLKVLKEVGIDHVAVEGVEKAIDGHEIWHSLERGLNYREGVNNVLKQSGYDGIVHIGGLNTDTQHNVAIPFDQSQIHFPWQPQIGDIEHLKIADLATSNGLRLDSGSDGSHIVRTAGGEWLAQFSDESMARKYINSMAQKDGPELVPNAPKEANAIAAPINPEPPTPPRTGEQMADGINIPFEKPGLSWVGRILQRTFFKPVYATRLPGILNGLAARTGVSLSAEFMRSMEAAKIGDALWAKAMYELGTEKAAKTIANLSEEQRTQVFKATEQESAGEIWHRLNDKEREYIKNFLSLDLQPDAKGETGPLDIHRIYKFVREYSLLDEIAKDRKWDDAKLASKREELITHYQKNGFTQNNQIAAFKYGLPLRNENINDAAMFSILRYIDALKSNAPTRNQFMDDNKFTPEMRARVEQSQRVYEWGAKELKLPPNRRIQDYATHLRANFEEMPSDLRTIFFDQPGLEASPSYKFWAALSRTGEIDNYLTDPDVTDAKYIRGVIRHRYVDPILEKNMDVVDKKINSMSGAGYRGQALKVKDNFERTIKGIPEPSDRALNDDWGAILKQAMEPFEKEAGIKFSDRAMKNFVSWISRNMTASYQGGRPGVSFRDFMSAMIMAYSRFDARTAIDIANRTFGNIEIDDNGIPKMTLGDFVERHRAQGILGRAYSTDYKPTGPMTSKNPVTRFFEGAGWIRDLAETTSGQRYIYDAIAAAGYDTFRAKAIDTFNELLKQNFTDPKQTRDFLNKRLSYEAFPPDLQVNILKTLRTMGVEAAAHEVGIRASMMINDTFGYGMAAVGWRSIMGTMLGRYGNYSVFAKDNLIDIMSYGSTGYRARVAGKMALTYAGLKAASVASGWNLTRYLWYTAIPFTGSPFVNFAYNTGKALEDALRQGDLSTTGRILDVLKEMGESQIPFMVLIKQYRAMGIPEGILNQFLLLTRQKGFAQ